MTRAPLVWGGAAAAIVGIGGLALAFALATTATATNHVQRYLDALAHDDLAAAARLAGLEPPTAMPLGDEGAPSIHRIVSSTTGSDGIVTVVAEYGTGADAVRVPFRLEAAPPTAGFVPAWAFVNPPVAMLSIAADQHDRFTANERTIVASGAGEAVSVAAFVPALVTVRIANPLLQAEPVTVRTRADEAAAIELAVEPSERLARIVDREIVQLLSDCSEQPVLQPTGCPFGTTIVDRVTTPPVWQLDTDPDVLIEPGDEPGVWRVRGTGSVQLTVSVQRLFDGVVAERVDQLGYIVRGVVIVGPDGPVLTVYPPDD